MNGTVKFFNDSKGFGFVIADDEKEYFVHISGVSDGLQLEQGMAVTFDIEEGPRGPKAVNVQKADDAPAAAAEESTNEEE